MMMTLTAQDYRHSKRQEKVARNVMGTTKITKGKELVAFTADHAQSGPVYFIYHFNG